MFTIWVKQVITMPIVRIDVDDIQVAQDIWDSLKAINYHMVSARP